MSTSSLRAAHTGALILSIALLGCAESESPATLTSATQANAPEEATSAAQTQAHTTSGTIESIDREANRVSIAHEPVPSLEWPAMTMAVEIEPSEALASLQQGQRVDFTSTLTADGRYVIERISPAP